MFGPFGPDPLAQSLRESIPEGVMHVLHRIDAEAIHADFRGVEGVDFDEFVDALVKSRALRRRPDRAQRKEIRLRLLTVRFPEAVRGKALARVGLELGEDARRLDLVSQDRERPVRFRLPLVPLRVIRPHRILIEPLALEGLNPFSGILEVKLSVPIGIVEKRRPRMMADDVLDDLDPLGMGERDEVLVMLHPSIARIGILPRAIEAFARGQMRIDIEEILRPVAMVAGIRNTAIVLSRAPDITHRRADPKGRDAERFKVPGFEGQLQSAQVAAVIFFDLRLRLVVERRIAAYGDIVFGITIEESVRQGKVDDVLIPGAIGDPVRPGGAGHEQQEKKRAGERHMGDLYRRTNVKCVRLQVTRVGETSAAFVRYSKIENRTAPGSSLLSFPCEAA